MEELRLDARDMKPRPCTKCEQVIQETVGGRGDPDETMTWGELALFIYNEEDTSGETDLGNPEGGRADSVYGAGVEPERTTRGPK